MVIVCRRNGFCAISSVLVAWSFWIVNTKILSPEWRRGLIWGIVALLISKEKIPKYKKGCLYSFCMWRVYFSCDFDEFPRKIPFKKCRALLLCIRNYNRFFIKVGQKETRFKIWTFYFLKILMQFLKFYLFYIENENFAHLEGI